MENSYLLTTYFLQFLLNAFLWTCILRIAGSSLTASGVLFCYGLLASLSLQIASMALEHHGKNTGGPN